MVSINYNRLFNLRISHDYFENGKAGGLNLHPTRATRSILRGGNMLFKTIPLGITVLYRAQDDEVTPFVELSADLKLTFVLRVENKAEFLNISDLDESPSKKYRSSNILHFSNDPSSASIDADSPEPVTHELLDSLRNALFTYAFTLETPPSEVLLRVRNSGGDLVSVGKTAEGAPLPTTLTLELNDDGSYSQQVDLRAQPAGTYSVTIRNSGDTDTLKEEKIYVSDELASRDILGVVDILYESATGHLYGDTEQYDLRFNRKESIWKYFIVNKNQTAELSDDPLSLPDLEIVDNGNGSPVYTTATFNREGDAPHANIKVNGLDTVIFKSVDPIPFFEVPKAEVQLKTSSDDTVLIEHLPNPSHSGAVKELGGELESEIYVFI